MPTMTENIFEYKTGRKARAGEVVVAKVDYALANDITAPLAINVFEQEMHAVPFNPDSIVLVNDHFVPCKDIKSAENAKQLRDFAKKYKIPHMYEGANGGVEHELLIEKGIAIPGRLIAGADSHTCTYGALGAFSTGVGSTDIAYAWATGELWFRIPESIKFIYNGELGKGVYGKDVILYTIGQIGVDGALYKAMEFSGEAIKSLSIPGRLTMSNMAIEGGGKAGLIEADKKTLKYINDPKNEAKIFKSGKDAVYEKVFEWDVSKLEPQVAFPHLPSNAKPISEAGEVPIDQAVIGSCTNGRLEDLEIAAEVLKGRKAHKDVRLIIIPATQKIYEQAHKKKLFEIFLKAGAIISPPTCGPCLGGHMGILAAGETAISSTNRNFVGRMGHPKSKVFLASPATVAASAIEGKIADCRKYL